MYKTMHGNFYCCIFCIFCQNSQYNRRPAFWCKIKNTFFAKFYTEFVTFLAFFSFLTQKMLKMTILTSVRGAQHLNAGEIMQHSIMCEGVGVRRLLLARTC